MDFVAARGMCVSQTHLVAVVVRVGFTISRQWLALLYYICIQLTKYDETCHTDSMTRCCFPFHFDVKKVKFV